MVIFDDLEAEEGRLLAIVESLDDAQLSAPSRIAACAPKGRTVPSPCASFARTPSD